MVEQAFAQADQRIYAQMKRTGSIDERMELLRITDALKVAKSSFNLIIGGDTK